MADHDRSRVGPSESLERRVLVVDDEELVRTVVAEMLRRAGFEVDEAIDGEDALLKMHQAAAHLVLTDLNMPRMDGWLLISALGRSVVYSGIPIIAMTGGPADEEALRRDGCVSILYKPLPSNLPALVRRELSKTAMRAEGLRSATGRR